MAFKYLAVVNGMVLLVQYQTYHQESPLPVIGIHLGLFEAVRVINIQAVLLFNPLMQRLMALVAAGWHKKADLHEHLVRDHRAASLFSISNLNLHIFLHTLHI